METLKLDPGEEKVAQFRKHWWVLAGELIFIFLLAIIPIILFPLFISSFVLPLKIKLFLIIIYLNWLIFTWILSFIILTNHYLDIWILTNKRLIDINQRSLFRRDIATLRLENIQDIKIEILGLINTVLKIGDIHIQTSASSKEFTMLGIKNPENAKTIINQTHQQKMEEAKKVKIENFTQNSPS